MLCDKCLNRTICKYYAFFADAPMIVTIESCEKARMTVEQPKFKSPNDNIALLNNFKQPIDYSKFNIPQEEEEETDEEERVFVDLSQQTEEKEISMMDLLLEGENKDDKKSKRKITD